MFVFLAFTNGLFAVLARVVNAALSDHVGSLRGSFVNHATGLVAVATLLLGGAGSGALLITNVNPVYLSGGVLGVLVVAASNYAVRHAGSTLFAVLILTFQLLGSAIIDHFGWLGQTPITLSWTRLLGLCLLIGGAILVVTDQEAIEEVIADAPAAEKS
ncbi:transporter family-2 protein [Salinibacter ruber]|uniref:DMT family transporter n=1 Tax=Salinibacter ruber TaxID=146919 RepID=UPI002167DE6D|nr:DMT family transporter [Salinibacter ruber]MCS4153318.1 transporter family-2 protein [Salinibacter ruber]